MKMKKIVSLTIMASCFALLVPVTTYAAEGELAKTVQFENHTKDTVLFEIEETKADGTGSKPVSSGDIPTGYPGTFPPSPPPRMSAPEGEFFGHEGSFYKVFIKTENEFKDSGKKKFQWGSNDKLKETLKIGTKSYSLVIIKDGDIIHMALSDI